MKLVKSLLLGSAAGIVAVGSAVAADLPVRKAAPVDYVQVCSQFGTGYFFIPGTDTCLRVGGFVRYQAQYSQSRWGVDSDGDTATERGRVFSQFARARLNVNAQTATEFGTLSSTIGLDFTDDAGSRSSGVDYAFIDFAGFRFGRAPSYFRTVGAPSFVGGNVFRSLEGSSPLAAYTLDAGAFSAFIAAEGNRTSVSTNAPLTGTAFASAPSGMPDIVGGFEFSEGDIRVKVSGAVSELRSTNPDVSTKFGYALQAGAVLGLPMVGPSTNIQLQGTYAEGATTYVNPGVAGGRFTLATPDAFIDASGSLKKAKAWNVYGALNHGWTPQISQTLYASYGQYDAPSAVRGFRTTGNVVWNESTDAAQFSTFVIGNIFSWTPVSGLQVALDTNYVQTDAKRRIRVAGTGANARYAKDDHAWNATLRIQRNF